MISSQNFSDVNSSNSTTKASFPSAWDLRHFYQMCAHMSLSWGLITGNTSLFGVALEAGWVARNPDFCYKMGFSVCMRKKMLKIAITTLLCGSHSSTSPCFSHVTLHSSRSPPAFFMLEYQMPRSTKAS